MSSIDFKTKSEIISREMPRVNGNNQFKAKTIVAIDGGYSSVKGVSPNKVFVFPSYAKKAPSDFSVVGKLSEDDIQYMDNKTGDIWLVGKTAEATMDQSDVDSTTDASLYTRYRYNSEVYRVIMATGLALGLMGTGEGNEIFLQTGLPSAYVNRDSAKLVQSLCGDYDVSLKIGNTPFTRFKFSLDEEHIDVMEQPKGTLNNLIYKDGKPSEIATKILKSSVVVLDIGFGTSDIFAFKNSIMTGHPTETDTAMKSVFDLALKKISEEYPVDTKIFELQKYLTEGHIPYMDMDSDEYKMRYIEIAPYIEAANKELCEKEIAKLMQAYEGLKDYQYLVVTGGTGESRLEMIKAKLAGIPHLTVLAGNVNTPDLSCVYSNVLGYYAFRHAKMMSEAKKAAAGA